MNLETVGAQAIPEPVWQLAMMVVADQEIVPKSPAERHRERVNLCAAACLARAGLEFYVSKADAQRFEADLGQEKSFVLVEDAFDRLGWERRFYQAALRFNDAQVPELRKNNVLRLFERCREMAERCQ